MAKSEIELKISVDESQLKEIEKRILDRFEKIIEEETSKIEFKIE